MNKKYLIYIPFLTLLCSGATIKAEENEETPKKPLSSFSIEEKSFISPYLSTQWADVPQWARIDISLMFANKGDIIIKQLQKRIEDSIEHLGWKKGSQIIIDIPQWEGEEYGPDKNTWMKGIIQVQAGGLSFETDGTISIGITDGGEKLVIQRLKNKLTTPNVKIKRTEVYMKDSSSNQAAYYNPWILYIDGTISNIDESEKIVNLAPILDSPSFIFTTSEPSSVELNSPIPAATSYITLIQSLTDSPTYTYIQKPDFSKVGQTEAIVRITDRLDDYSIESDVHLNYNVVDNRNLTAEAIPQAVDLGTNIANSNLKELVKNVHLGEEVVGTNDYSVAIKTNADTTIVGDQKLWVTVTGKGKTVDIDVPVTVKWGKSLSLQGAYDDSVGVFTLHESGLKTYTLTDQVGVKRKNADSMVHSEFGGKIYYQVGIKKLNQETQILEDESNPSLTVASAYGQDDALNKINEFQTVELKEGDLIDLWHAEPKRNHLIVNENKIQENAELKNSYYEVTESGFQPLRINQLQTKEASTPLRTTTKELDDDFRTNMAKYIDSKEYNQIKPVKFVVFPDTTKPGKQLAKVRVEETLHSGKKVQFDYDVQVNVKNEWVHVTIPTKMLFFSDSNHKEKVTSKKYKIKNNSDNTTLMVSMNSFVVKQNSEVTYLSEKESDPTYGSNSLRLNLTVDGKEVARSLNVTSKATDLVELNPKTGSALSFEGNYFNPESKNSLHAESSLVLKFAIKE